MRTKEEIQGEIDDLNRRLKKRDGKVGFAANVAAIRDRIAECQSELANAGS